MIFPRYEYFLKIAEEGNVSRAAEKLYISQPSLSKYIKRLENTIGIELFDHSSSPLTLTYAGERYLKYINQYLALEKQIRNEFSDIKSNLQGRTTLGIGRWRTSTIMPHVLPSFWEQYPNIEVVLREELHYSFPTLLENDIVDFCMSYVPMPYEGLSYEYLMREPVLLAIHSSNPVLTNLELPAQFDVHKIVHIDFTKVLDQLFIFPQGQKLTENITEFLNRYSFYPQKVFKTESVSTALGLVNAGIGITFVPLCGVCFRTLPENVSFFTVGEPVNSWDLGFIYKANAPLSRSSRLFIDHIKKCFENIISNPPE